MEKGKLYITVGGMIVMCVSDAKRYEGEFEGIVIVSSSSRDEKMWERGRVDWWLEEYFYLLKSTLTVTIKN